MTVGLKVCGAARTVTGLCLLFQAPDARFLVDCGMFQGPKTLKGLNYEPFPFDPRSLDFVLLTHAHIDHSGLLPKLVKEGFRGRIHATPAAIDLCSCMLPDAGHVQESEVEILNRRNRRRGRETVEPIYTAQDAERALSHFSAVRYGEWLAPGEGIRARWWNAGHMLGSASIEIEFALRGQSMRVLVSGDIGPDEGGLHGTPQGPTGGIDHVIAESTYGDEDRAAVAPEARRATLRALARRAADRGGNLLIPTFAVERAQEVILDLVQLMQAGEIPEAPIHLDSPLATRASRVFRHHAGALQDGQAMRDALGSPRLRHVADGEESRRLARQEGFQIILAGSGMCEAGRIRQHLKARLWDPRTVVALVGFQAAGTLGRLLQDGARRVRIQGETIQVAATIRSIQGYSAHADGPELGRWLAARGPVHGGVFLVHGEPEAIEGLAKRVTGRGIAPEEAVIRPLLDEAFLLEPGAVPRRDDAAAPGRRAAAESVGQPDWHNARAALLLSIEEALDKAPDDRTREALLERLRQALHAPGTP
ncbi:metallo-beta-lactamase family protein [Roseomonas rosea]|uniref:Metallo-beta-lactamase family protein n=1 Tax=Muricoccus roseus TaxID=198092 RepID=A0A1M6PEH5_9PROT|nr:MBL fold metallo-hydrolase [Roseomonas rosea]SHK06324.1 metallo-beta-lactamase family protein [Roseomonas rosea]